MRGRRPQRGLWHLTAIISSLLLAACVSVRSMYLHDWMKPMPANALPTPKVGAVIFIELNPAAAPESDTIIDALEKALIAELAQRGYDPMPLPAQRLTTSITEAIGIVHIGKVWEQRPKAEALARAQASANNLSGLFVAWVTIRRTSLYGSELPSQQLVLAGATALEVYSAQGEALYSTRKAFTGGTKIFTEDTGLKVTETWRVFSVDETASLAMREAMRGYFGGIQPFTPSM